MAPKSYTLNAMPLRFMLKRLFEIPGLLKYTLKNINCPQISTICNFANGEIFRKQSKRFLPGDLLIPYHLYFDDYTRYS